MTILPAVLKIGFIVSQPMDLLDYGKKNVLVVPAAFPPFNRKKCENIYYFHLGNLVTIKISGMDNCFLIIFRNNFLSTCVLDNVKIFFINWVLPYKDLVDKHQKLTMNNKKNLKKIRRMDKRSRYRTLGRRRSSFSTSQQSHSYLGTKRRTTTCPFCFYSAKTWFLWSSQFEDRRVFDSRSFCFQYRNLPRFSLPSDQFYSQTYPFNFRSCQLPQSPRFRIFSHQVASLSQTDLSTSIFTRTQSSGKSLENHTPTRNTQPILPEDRRPSGSSYKPICSMGIP